LVLLLASLPQFLDRNQRLLNLLRKLSPVTQQANSLSELAAAAMV
jgi:hypothetical protein